MTWYFAFSITRTRIGNWKIIVSLYECFVVVERGEIGSTELGEFKLDKYISRRPKVLKFHNGHSPAQGS
jgi:hypothetical protein